MKKVFALFLLIVLLPIYTFKVYADSATQTAIGKGINYLGTQLNGATGQIQNGSTGDASPWAAIAFAANGTDPSTVKSSTGAPSLVDYLKTAHPTTSSAITDWEKWILAIVASNQNPYDFGGVNYIANLESSTYYNNNQLGDATTATDDWFGVLALIAGGVNKNDAVLNNSLSFILAHQNADGGFGYSITAGSDGNDTAAAIQALAAAQNYGVTNATLSAALSNAKTYFLSTQDKSGGFLYDTNPWTTSPDSDSTTWALMTLNALGMQNATQWNNASSWLISQQSQTDGGFTACNQWDPNTFACTGYASNSTTTSHGLIGLSGKTWLLQSYNPSSGSVAPTSSITPTITPTGSAPTPTPIVITNTTTTTIVVTPTPGNSPAQQIVYLTKVIHDAPTSAPSQPTQAVLGAQTEQKIIPVNPIVYILPTFFATLGGVFLGAFFWDKFLKQLFVKLFSK